MPWPHWPSVPWGGEDSEREFEISLELEALQNRRHELHAAASRLPVGVLRSEAAAIERRKHELYARKRAIMARYWLKWTDEWTPFRTALDRIMRQSRTGERFRQGGLPPRGYWKQPTGFPNGRPCTNHGNVSRALLERYAKSHVNGYSLGELLATMRSGPRSAEQQERRNALALLTSDLLRKLPVETIAKAYGVERRTIWRLKGEAETLKSHKNRQ
jgi:hypothetical protein